MRLGQLWTDGYPGRMTKADTDLVKQVASLLGQLRWEGKTKDEKSQFMNSVRSKRSNAPGGRNGGRPRKLDSCYCGLRSRHSAEMRRFDCCKKVGKFPTGQRGEEVF